MNQPQNWSPLREMPDGRSVLARLSHTEPVLLKVSKILARHCQKTN